MDHPKKQISSVIHRLTEGSPADQKDALDTYFLPDASFMHPLCRVPSFSSHTVPMFGDINSRWVIWMIYRWYKILSPRIVLTVECDEYNQKSQLLFVEISQSFSLFFVPFYTSHVHLTTKLRLHHSSSDNKYYIQSQEDLYQLNEILKFFAPGGATLLWVWQVLATAICVLGSLLLAPVTWLEQRNANGNANGVVNGVKKGE